MKPVGKTSRFETFRTGPFNARTWENPRAEVEVIHLDVVKEHAVITPMPHRRDKLRESHSKFTSQSNLPAARIV